MSKVKILLSDFDRTLIDSSSIEHLYHKTLTKEEEKLKRSLGKTLPLIEGWREVLKELENRGIIFAIVSRNQKTFINFMTKHLKINPKTIVGRYGTKYKFPQRKPLGKNILIAQALEELGLTDINPEEVLYLGDQAKDMVWTKEFGAKAGACFWATAEKELLENSPYDFHFTSPLDILDVL